MTLYVGTIFIDRWHAARREKIQKRAKTSTNSKAAVLFFRAVDNGLKWFERVPKCSPTRAKRAFSKVTRFEKLIFATVTTMVLNWGDSESESPEF
jgi:hypothetical protein